MQRELCAMAMGLAAAVGSAAGQSVEFRLVERQGQAAIGLPPGTTATTDAVLNMAVQARVVGGTNVGLGNFQMNIRIVGESDTNGDFDYLLISNTNGTYATNPNQTANATVGRGGLAAPYAYLAGITNGFFNGIINISAGNYTNTQDQEILAITGSPTGASMLLVTDANEDGIPDTYNGPLPVPAQGATATLDPAIANVYFAANGNWIDVYRFKYVVSNVSTARLLRMRIESAQGQVFTGWQRSNSVWGPAGAMNAPTSAVGLDVFIGNPTFGACCQGSACAVLEQSACLVATGQFRGSGAACEPAGSFNACCAGNFDGVNGLGVEDIFAFLNAWFDRDPRADADHSGALEVVDVFAFIGVWRNGC